MTRVRHWAVAGAVLPTATIGALAILVTLGQGAESVTVNVGTALLALMTVVPPSAAVASAIGWAVLAVARRLPERGSRGRTTAVGLSTCACFALGAVAGMSLLPFTSSDGLTALAVVAHGVVFAVLPTAGALVAWSRYPDPDPAGPSDDVG